MQVTALIRIILTRALRSGASIVAALSGFVVLVIIMGGKPEKGFLLISAVATYAAFGLIPTAISGARTDGMIEYLRGMPISRNDIGLACLFSAGFTSMLFSGVAVATFIPGLEAIGYHLGAEVGTVALSAMAVLGFSVSIILIPLYAKLPAIFAALAPVLIVTLAYPISKFLPIQAVAKRAFLTIASTDRGDTHLMLILVCVWVLLILAAKTMVSLMGASFGVRPPPTIDFEAFVKSIKQERRE